MAVATKRGVVKLSLSRDTLSVLLDQNKKQPVFWIGDMVLPSATQICPPEVLLREILGKVILSQ